MKRFLKPRHARAGQAMAEMVLGLVAMLVVMVGIITFGDVGHQYVTSVLRMLGDASRDAVDPNSTGTPVNFDYYMPWHNVLSSPIDYPNYMVQNPYQKEHNFDYRISPANGEAFWTPVYSESAAFAPRVDLGDAVQKLFYIGNLSIKSGEFCWPRLTNLDKP
ncbi:MAG: pilus assembly protein [Verrucomicrobia bacterium]|nr:pilus assembly protein [Verrucomicrobiota bacterium]